MGPSDVDIVRVYTRVPGAAVAEETFPTNYPIEIVVEAEAGTDAHGTGGQFEVGVVVRDLSACGVVGGITNVLPTHPSGTAGNFGNAEWPAAGYQTFRYTIPANTIPEDHVCEVLAWLRYRIANPDVSFARSPLFIMQMAG